MVRLLPVEPEEPSKMHLAINLNFEQGHEVGHGRQIHTIGSFSTIQCSCKSKSHIVTNFPMRPCAVSSIELAGYGVHAFFFAHAVRARSSDGHKNVLSLIGYSHMLENR